MNTTWGVFMSLIYFDVLFSSSISIISIEVILRILAFIIYGYGNVWVQIYVGVLLNWIVLFTSGILTSASLVNFSIGCLVLTFKGLVCGAVYLKGVLFNEQSNTILINFVPHPGLVDYHSIRAGHHSFRRCHVHDIRWF
jgi:hypothetical protein